MRTRISFSRGSWRTVCSPIIIAAASGIFAGVAPDVASANPPGVGGAPGHAEVLQMMYNPAPDTATYGRVWTHGAFGASHIGGYFVNIDTDGNGTKERALGFCIEFWNSKTPVEASTWAGDPGSWDRPPTDSRAPAHKPTEKDTVKASYVLWKYGRPVTMPNDQAAAVAYLIHFYAQDRSDSSSGFSVLVPDLNNNDILDEPISVRIKDRTGAESNIDELMKRYDAEAEAWGAAFNFRRANVKAGVLATAAGLSSRTTGKALPVGTFTVSGNARTTAALMRPVSASIYQSVTIAGKPQSAVFTTPVVSSRAVKQLVTGGPDHPASVVDTISVAKGTPSGRGEVWAGVYDRTNEVMTSIVTPKILVALNASGAVVANVPAVQVPVGEWEFVEAFTDFGPDKKKGGLDDITVTRNPKTTPAPLEQFKVVELQVETQSLTPNIAVKTNVITPSNITLTATGAIVTGVGTASASPLRDIIDRMKATGATPGGRVDFSLFAYPVIDGEKDCTRGRGPVAASATADASGMATAVSPPIKVDSRISFKWEFIETATDVTTGTRAGRVCETSPVILVETSTITGPTPGATSKTYSVGKINVKTMTVTASDFVGAYGGFAGDKVTATVTAYPISAKTNKRVCSAPSKTVKGTATLNAQGIAVFKMPPVTIDLRYGLKFEFIEKMEFSDGVVVTRSCEASTPVIAEQIRFKRDGDVKIWETGTVPEGSVPGDTVPDTEQAMTAAAVTYPKIGTISIPKLSVVNRPIVSAPPSLLSILVGGDFWHRDNTEPLCLTGNPVIGGHRSAFGGALRNIHLLEVGDTLTVTPTRGTPCTYKVVTTHIAAVTNTAAIQRWTSSQPLFNRDQVLTLFSCTTPDGTKTNRGWRYFVTFERVS